MTEPKLLGFVQSVSGGQTKEETLDLTLKGMFLLQASEVFRPQSHRLNSRCKSWSERESAYDNNDGDLHVTPPSMPALYDLSLRAAVAEFAC